MKRIKMKIDIWDPENGWTNCIDTDENAEELEIDIDNTLVPTNRRSHPNGDIKITRKRIYIQYKPGDNYD